jgi:hypothetical protein
MGDLGPVELTVGSHTMRAPPRAATSNAVAFRPPTAWFSVAETLAHR